MRQMRKLQKHSIMNLPWCGMVIYAGLGSLILWIFDKFQIIKSKQLRYFIVTFVYSLVFWVIYDLVVTPE